MIKIFKKFEDLSFFPLKFYFVTQTYKLDIQIYNIRMVIEIIEIGKPKLHS